MATKKWKAYVLRSVSADMTSRGGFKWPEKGLVECPDWAPTQACGAGLHGFLWGEGVGALADWSPDAKWLVVGVDEWVDLDGKVKFPRGEVVFCGEISDAAARIAALGAMGAVIGGTAKAGDYGTATAGDYGTATAGDGGTAKAGNGGTATAGDGGTAKAGDGGTAKAGNGGTATAGNGGTATAGYRGTAKAGNDGTVVVRWWDGSTGRSRLAVGYVGEDGIEPDVGYKVDNGRLVKA